MEEGIEEEGGREEEEGGGEDVLNSMNGTTKHTKLSSLQHTQIGFSPARYCTSGYEYSYRQAMQSHI